METPSCSDLELFAGQGKAGNHTVFRYFSANTDVRVWDDKSVLLKDSEL
jgi:hypothetical protein